MVVVLEKVNVMVKFWWSFEVCGLINRDREGKR